jgi:hypothetical protein
MHGSAAHGSPTETRSLFHLAREGIMLAQRTSLARWIGLRSKNTGNQLKGAVRLSYDAGSA